MKKEARKRWLAWVGAFSALAALVLVSPVLAEDPPQKKVFAADKGPDSIDVSAFPEEIQGYYSVFAARCSKCHTLARPINTDLSTQAWKRYVKRMMNKPDSGISPSTGKKIYKFLKYYQKVKDAKKAKGEKTQEK